MILAILGYINGNLHLRHYVTAELDAEAWKSATEYMTSAMTGYVNRDGQRQYVRNLKWDIRVATQDDLNQNKDYDPSKGEIAPDSWMEI